MRKGYLDLSKMAPQTRRKLLKPKFTTPGTKKAIKTVANKKPTKPQIQKRTFTKKPKTKNPKKLTVPKKIARNFSTVVIIEGTKGPNSMAKSPKLKAPKLKETGRIMRIDGTKAPSCITKSSKKLTMAQPVARKFKKISGIMTCHGTLTAPSRNIS